jgi:hypothetical protein
MRTSWLLKGFQVVITVIGPMIGTSRGQAWDDGEKST